VATEQEENWQDVKTPEWVAREMVRCIPDLKTRSRFLVLFNVEILEALVKEGVQVSKITFGSDSALEEAMVQATYKRLKTIRIGKTFDEMKEALKDHAGQYEVVLSNPPYQVQSNAQKDRQGNGSVQAKPIYHEIVTYAIKELKPQYVCMITPSKWMGGGMGLEEYRARMLKDKSIRLIQDFPGAYDVFESVKIESGVSYFLWDRDYSGFCEFNGIQRDIGEFDVLIRNNMAHQIVKRVRDNHKEPFCNSLVLPNKPFGLATNFKDWSEPGTGMVECVCRGREIHFVAFGKFTDDHGIQSKWKVCTPAAYGENTSEGVAIYSLKGSFILGPGAICTETYIILGSFKTKKEATNYLGYANSKFYRFMVSTRKSTQHLNTQKFSWVPDLGNYANPVTDEELYAHFNLTRNEINHINSTIKEI
jgi:site-specific DNA-methyltransferase (adenine-specific)